MVSIHRIRSMDSKTRLVSRSEFTSSWWCIRSRSRLGRLPPSPTQTQANAASYFSGFKNKDVAWFHVASKSLIVADLLMSLPPTEQYSKTTSWSRIPFLGDIGPYSSLYQKTLLSLGVNKEWVDLTCRDIDMLNGQQCYEGWYPNRLELGFWEDYHVSWGRYWDRCEESLESGI